MCKSINFKYDRRMCLMLINIFQSDKKCYSAFYGMTTILEI